MKSLIVDDEKINQSILLHFLSNYGQCITAEDGEEAIYEFKEALLQNEPFQLICMDIMMPKIDGHRALKEIRYLEKCYNLPKESFAKVIVTSALSDSGNANMAFYQDHADAYLIKPIHIKQLADLLKQLQLI